MVSQPVGLLIQFSIAKFYGFVGYRRSVRSSARLGFQPLHNRFLGIWLLGLIPVEDHLLALLAIHPRQVQQSGLRLRGQTGQ